MSCCPYSVGVHDKTSSIIHYTFAHCVCMCYCLDMEGAVLAGHDPLPWEEGEDDDITEFRGDYYSSSRMY